MLERIVTAEHAVDLIGDGDSVVVGGSSGMGVAESVLSAIERAFLERGRPKALTVIHTTGLGDTKTKGLNHLAHEGLVRRVVGSAYDLIPGLRTLIGAGTIEAQNVPQGVMCQLYRAMAAGQPGVLTHVGLGTYMDPRQEGGKLNEATTGDMIEVVALRGREWLFYAAPTADIAIIRGTTADEDGNVGMEHEAVTLEGHSIAQAVHNAGGTVICQVKRLARRGALHPQMVAIPGFLIDYFVVDEDQWQTNLTPFDASLCGEAPRPLATLPPDPLSERRVIARRQAFALYPGAVINLGVGVSALIPNVVAEEGIDDLFTATAESGIIGGIPCSGLEFGATYNPQAIIEQPSMFDFYDGGGLDVAFVSFAEVDRDGNVNVTKFGNRPNGCGGFIGITQNAKSIVFGGTLTSRGLEVEFADGRITIANEGEIMKFVPRVAQISYSGRRGRDSGQDVTFVTERAVFRMMPEGLVLREIAPGVRLKEDVLDRMGFEPAVSPDLGSMDPRLFREGPMGLRQDVLAHSAPRPGRRARP